MYVHVYELDGRRESASSSSSSPTGHSYTTAAESVQRTISGLGVTNSNSNRNSASDDNNAPRSSCSSQLAMRPTALGSHGSRWLGGSLSADTRGGPRGLGGDLDLRSGPLSRLRSADGRWQRQPEDDVEAWDEMTTFLRNVTPPPTNYMSAPTEPYSPSIISSRSIIKRNGSRKRKGLLTRCLMFLKGRSKRRKSVRKTSVRASSPPVARTTSRKNKRPPRIKLPDTAVSGRTVGGHRHIAITIPIEYDHLTPEPRNGFRKADRRAKSLPPVEMGPAVYNNGNVRPMSAFANEPCNGTQLGPVVGKRGTLSSRPRTRDSQRGQEDAHNSRIAPRHTFSPVQEEVSSPNMGSMLPPKVPRRTSDRYDTTSSLGRPSTSQTNDDLRNVAHRETLAALSRPRTAPRPVSVQSTYSFRSFATPSPSSRVYYPVRKTSLHPSTFDNDKPLARGALGQRSRNPHSRDSSGDKYTLQESIFSERSFLENVGTVESASETESGVTTMRTQAGGLPFPAGVVPAATAPGASFERHDGYSSQNGDNRDRESNLAFVQGNRRNSGQEIRRGSRQESEKGPIWKRRGSVAAVLVNPEMKTVEAHAVRQSQLRKSVEIVLETPTEASWPDKMSEGSGKEDEDSLGDAADGPSNETESKGKGKEWNPEGTPMLKVPGEKRELRDKGKKPPGPLPSRKQRDRRRKEILLSREQKIAELRKKLEAPGTEPKDLVWRRQSSSSSDGSFDEGHSTDEATTVDKMTTPNHVPAAPESKPNSLEATPGRFSLSAVMTVADVKPSSLRTASPELRVTNKESLRLSASSCATMATVVRASPVPPYQGLESVTPPDSPPSSPTSSSPVSTIEAQPRRSPLEHLPFKRPNSFQRRPSTSGIQPHVSGDRRSPIIEDGPSRPRTSSNGLLPSTFYSERHTQEGDYADDNTSIMKTPRTELSTSYEVQDMKRRLTKLERYRDHWATSMIPLLTDMGQALGKLATSNGKGKGKKVDRSLQAERQSWRPNTSNSDGRQDRVWRRNSASEDAESTTCISTEDDEDDLDSDEVITRHPRHSRTGGSRAGTNTNTSESERPRRPDPLDEAAARPGFARGDVYDDFADDECRARNHRRRGRTTSAPLPPSEAARPPQRVRTSSAATVMGSSGAGAGGNSVRAVSRGTVSEAPALPLQTSLREEAGRLERLERRSRRAGARMRPFSLGGRSARGVGGLVGAEDHWDMELDGYAAAAEGSGGIEALQGLMKELQVLGSRLGMDGVDGYGNGVREPPRAVVGFGAFK